MKLKPSKLVQFSEYEWFIMKDNIEQVKWRLRMNLTVDNKAALGLLEQCFPNG